MDIGPWSCSSEQAASSHSRVEHDHYTADDLDVIRRVAAGCEETPPNRVPRQIEIVPPARDVAPEAAGWESADPEC